MKKFTIFAVIVASAAVVLTVQKARAISANANATQVVTAALQITKVSDLDFGTAAQGDAAKPVAAGTAETAENASFTVTGTANAAYTITLPSTATMTTGAGGANETIAVSSFTSFPATTGTLSALGTQSLFVGATRAALGGSQALGSYTGSFTVTVVY